MMKEFKGRPLIPGKISGEVVVSTKGFNPLATYKDSLIKQNGQAICGDQDNKDLYKKDLKDKIICLPQVIGSTTGGIVISTAAYLGIGPKALLFTKHIDTLAASGVIFSDIWVDKRIITIDQLGDDFLNYVKDGMIIEIEENGIIKIQN